MERVLITNIWRPLREALVRFTRLRLEHFLQLSEHTLSMQACLYVLSMSKVSCAPQGVQISTRTVSLGGRNMSQNGASWTPSFIKSIVALESV